MDKSQKNIGDWASENKFIQFVVRVGNFLPVAFVVLLVAWSYYAFVVRLCILHLFNENYIQGVIYLVIFHPLLLMMMWCYFVATFTSPGYPNDPISPKSSRFPNLPGTTISSQYHPPEINSSPETNNPLLSTKPSSSKQKPNIILDESGNPISLGSIMVKQSGEKRYCQKCQYDKPDRTHHCRVCKRCILKMDHHCPWLNNCIGFRNQKSFYLFVIWGSIYSLYITIATIPPTVNYLQYSNEATIMSLDLNISFLILIGGVFALSLMGFAIYHTNLLLSNQTTLESLMTKQNFKMRETDEVTSGKLLNLFDVGKRANFLQAMGPTWYLWFFPVGEPMGDGKTWLLNTARYSSLMNSADNLPGTPQTV